MDDRLIANIIYRELFSYNALYMPNVGYLSLVNHSAELSQGGDSLIPPYKTLAVFPLDSPIEGAVDIILSISQNGNMDYNSAYNYFDCFITCHINNSILDIPFVLTLNLDDLSVITVDDRLKYALENQNMTSIAVVDNRPTIRRPQLPNSYRRNLSSGPGTFMIVMSLLTALVALGYIAYYFSGINLTI